MNINKLSILPTMIIFSAALSGCNDMYNQIAQFAIDAQPAIVISSGFEIDINGKKTLVKGYDACPKADDIMLKIFGPSINDGRTDCIVLANDRTKVHVSLLMPAGAIQEDWAIIRKTGKMDNGRPYARTYLQRPDGSQIIPASAQLTN